MGTRTAGRTREPKARAHGEIGGGSPSCRHDQCEPCGHIDRRADALTEGVCCDAYSPSEPSSLTHGTMLALPATKQGKLRDRLVLQRSVLFVRRLSRSRPRSSRRCRDVTWRRRRSSFGLYQQLDMASSVSGSAGSFQQSIVSFSERNKSAGLQARRRPATGSVPKNAAVQNSNAPGCAEEEDETERDASP